MKYTENNIKLMENMRQEKAETDQAELWNKLNPSGTQKKEEKDGGTDKADA